MPRSLAGLLSSNIIEIEAEGGAKKFSVHSKILVPSKTLTAIVAKAPGQKIELLSWDGDTVGCLVDFLYLGDYEVPDPEPLLAKENLDLESVTSEEEDSVRAADTPCTSRPESSMSARSEITVQGAESMMDVDRPLTPLSKLHESPKDDSWQQAIEIQRLSFFNPSTHTYVPVLLRHAKVYALAKYADVEALESLAHERLLTVLMSFDSGSVPPTDIAQLLRYIYNHTTSSEDPMRRLVSQFAALNFTTLQGNEGIAELLKIGGGLVTDLLDKVRRRLLNTEAQLALSQAAQVKLEISRKELDISLQIERWASKQAQLSLVALKEHLTSDLKVERTEIEQLENRLHKSCKVDIRNDFITFTGPDKDYWDFSGEQKDPQPKTYLMLASSRVKELVEIVALNLGYVDPNAVHLWAMARRVNKTIRPVTRIRDLEMTIGDAVETYGYSGDFFLWAESYDSHMLSTISNHWIQDLSTEDAPILVFLKHYDTVEKIARGTKHVYVTKKDIVAKLMPMITSWMNWPPNQLIELTEEVREGMLTHRSPKTTFYSAAIQNGDIIRFQKVSEM